MAKAVDLVSATESTLELFCTVETWERLFTYTKDVSRVKEINVGDISASRTRILPQHFQDGIVCISTGSQEALSTSEQYKINLYFPAIDALLNEFKTRFNKDSLVIMKAIAALNPTSPTFLDPSRLQPMAQKYGLDVRLLFCNSSLILTLLCFTKEAQREA